MTGAESDQRGAHHREKPVDVLKTYLDHVVKVDDHRTVATVDHQAISTENDSPAGSERAGVPLGVDKRCGVCGRAVAVVVHGQSSLTAAGRSPPRPRMRSSDETYSLSSSVSAAQAARPRSSRVPGTVLSRTKATIPPTTIRCHP